MGRPYSSELSAFPSTYDWALTLDIEDFAGALRRAAALPLIAIGSGGSLSAAQFCADWHQQATGRLARTVTPLEAVAMRIGLGSVAAAVFSAGGRNADIRHAFATILEAEPEVSWVLTGAAQSPLAEAARAAPTAPLLFARSQPAGRDGFLATNSLLAFALQTHRAYSAAFPGSHPERLELPSDWLTFVEDGGAVSGAHEQALWSASTLVVLHGYHTRAAAVDLESKCTEAGLLHVQLADFRNFAHGRHHWLAKHPDTAVLALVTREDASLAERTLALLPRTIPQGHLRIDDEGPRAGLRALVKVMFLVEAIGRAKGIDPGRPGVPAFGGKLYSLRGIDLFKASTRRLRSRSDRSGRVSDEARTAIERKIQRPIDALSADERVLWLAQYDRACRHLGAQSFRGIVFDYDGTLVDAADRYSGPRIEILSAITALLEQDVILGIATGRGQSAGKELRGALPHLRWEQIVMGYYNGGDICSLSAMERPNRTAKVHDALAPVLEALESSPTVKQLAEITSRRPQITLEPRDVSRAHDLWAAVEGTVLRMNTGARAVRSSHSIDVLAPGVSKVSIVDTVLSRTRAASGDAVLRIGDRGAWPGNDAELLAVLDGVSVDEVSADPFAAWNFAPPGIRGVAATRAFLDHVSVQGDSVRVLWSSNANRDQTRSERTRKSLSGGEAAPTARSSRAGRKST